MMRRESLPDGLDFPSFPSLELSKLTFLLLFPKLQNLYLVYSLQNQTALFYYINLNFSPWNNKKECLYTCKEFVVKEAMKQKCGELSYFEL